MSAAEFTRSIRHQFGGALVLIGAVLLAAAAYLPGATGGLHFDDAANLSGLAQVSDFPSAIHFIFTGNAGPSGRPIALASFALQAYAWPSAPEVFLRTNITLHLLNGVLVVWLLYALCRTRGYSLEKASWVGSLSGALWLLSPLLASSSLFIVQRMTILSATFLFLGFIGYIHGRRSIDKHPLCALALMTLSVSLGTALAFLAKENGALLPMFILVAELTLLPCPSERHTISRWRVWCWIVLGIPTLAITVYLLRQVPYSQATLLFRGFTGSERVLTEASALWQYLYHAFIPSASGLGPFHDDQMIYSQWLQPSHGLAVVAWITVIAAAVRFRKRAPLFLFAVAWYLVGHSLESTTIPLELYYEHRNYVPLIGPIYAVVATVLSAAPRRQTIVRCGLVAYGLLSAAVLFSFTSLWGQPTLAAKMWAREHPDSIRATQYLARQLDTPYNHDRAIDVLQQYLARHRNAAGITLQALTLSCLSKPHIPHQQIVEQARADLQIPKFRQSVLPALQRLYDIADGGKCTDIKPDTVYGFTAIAASNPAYRANSMALQNLQVLMAGEAMAQKNLDLTMHHLESALAARFTINTLSLAVGILDSAGLYTDAREFVERGRHRIPWRPLRARIWTQRLADLDKAIDFASRHAELTTRDNPKSKLGTQSLDIPTFGSEDPNDPHQHRIGAALGG